EGLGGLGNPHAQSSRETHNGGVPGRQVLGGDELHARHGNGGKHRHCGAPQHALGNGGQQRCKFGGDARQQQESPGNGEHRPVHHLVGGDDAHILG
ncbi:Sporulation protein YabP, partial [Dysosmobacter welbionis]